MRVTKRKTNRKRSVKLRTNGKHKVDAASTISTPIGFGMNRILRPQARFNWLLPSLAAITPQYIEMTLNGALAGNHVQQYELFDLMLRTWPELSACSNELFEGVLRKKLVFEPFCEEDEKPTPSAIEKTKLISAALREMEPDSENDGNDLEGTLKNILDAWIRGFSVSEVVWNSIDVNAVGTITAPRTTFWVQPVAYAFASDNRIGLAPVNSNGYGIPYPFTTTNPRETVVQPFPPNKFLIAIHKAKSGSPLAGPLFVPLAWWWCAANFSSDWLLNLAQLFGLPFRWGAYPRGTPDDAKVNMATMLQNMGSAGWAMLEEGQTLNFLTPSGGSQGSDHSPQGELLDRADRYARLLILGQTMTGTHGTTGKGGGQAFGVVEADVKADRIDAAGKFAVSVINRQLIPYILALNYGETSEAPSIKFLEDEVAGLAEAQRDTFLSKLMPIGFDYLRKKYDVPEPADGEETTSDNAPMPTSFGQFGQQQDQTQQDAENPTETQATDEESEPAKASEYEVAKIMVDKLYAKLTAGDKPGHAFHGNQHVVIGERVNTPHGQGIVVAQDYTHLWVSTNKGIKMIPREQVIKIPRIDEKKFPSITHSAENERRAKLNEQLKSLNAITDDAVYSRELLQLAGDIRNGD